MIRRGFMPVTLSQKTILHNFYVSRRLRLKSSAKDWRTALQELTNFFERRVSSYQVAVQGEVAFDHPF
jgi:hypothetical protein